MQLNDLFADPELQPQPPAPLQLGWVKEERLSHDLMTYVLVHDFSGIDDVNDDIMSE